MEQETEVAVKNRKHLHCEPLPEKPTVKGDFIDKKYLTDTRSSYLLRMDAAQLLAVCKQLETTPFSPLEIITHGYRDWIDVFCVDHLNTHQYLDNLIGMLHSLGCSCDMQELGEYKACAYER